MQEKRSGAANGHKYDTTMLPFRRQVIRLCCVALLIALGVLVAFPTSGYAHARLTASDPVSGSALVAAPSEISLAFSESIVQESLSATLTLPDGSVSNLAIASITDDSVNLVSPGSTQSGTWIIRWSLISATDGHGSNGFVVFSVGTGRSPTTAGPTDDGLAWSDFALRAMWLFVLVAIAICAFGRWRRRWVIAGLAITAIALPLIQLGTDLSNRSIALQLAAGITASVSALILVGGGRAHRALALAVWVVALTLLASSGHSIGADHPVLATVVTAIHLVLALVWLALLGSLAISRDPNLRGRAKLERFSRVLVIGVAVLALAGITLGLITVPGQQALRTTTYGSTLLWKQIAVLLAVALAAANLIIVRPWVATGSAEPGISRQSHWVLRAEALAILTAVIFGAALSQTSPPDRVVLTTVASPIKLVDESRSVSDITVHLTGAITLTTDDRLSIYVLGNSGIQRVIVGVSESPASAGIPDSDRFEAEQGVSNPSQWSFSALRLPYPAIWDVEITVRRAGVEDVIAPFRVDTSTWIAEQPRSSSRGWEPVSGPISVIALVLLAMVVLVGGWFYIRRSGPIQPAIGAVIVVALVAIAAGFVIQATQRLSIKTPDHDLAVPEDASAAQGEQLFGMMCASCHGPAGEGLDEISPNHQHGSGTSLIDAATKRRSEGDLYWVLSNGAAATDMPAYDLALPETDRWNLIAYLRQIQGQPSPAP
jgi:copper transport protein